MRTGFASTVALIWSLGCSSESGPGNPSGAEGGAGGTSSTVGATSSGAGGTAGVSGQGTSGSGANAGQGNAASGGSGNTAGAAAGGTSRAGTSGAGGASGSNNGGQAGSGGETARCAATVTTQSRTTVAAALDGLFVEKQVSAIDQYWGEPYAQHNPIAQSGVAAFKSIMSSVVGSSSFSYQRLRTLADCEYAVVQGRYSGTGVIFDMFRVKDGKLVEHWDSDSNQASDAGGPTERVDTPDTAKNRAQVLSFLDATLIAGSPTAATTLLSPSYVEHRETTADGSAAFVEYVADDDVSYSKVHHVIADGNFVFTLSEGELGTAGYAFYDLFRVEGGAIVEHWDSRRRVPASTASGLPIF